MIVHRDSLLLGSLYWRFNSLKKLNNYHFVVYATKKGEVLARLHHAYHLGATLGDAERLLREEFSGYKIHDIELKDINLRYR